MVKFWFWPRAYFFHNGSFVGGHHLGLNFGCLDKPGRKTPKLVFALFCSSWFYFIGFALFIFSIGGRNFIFISTLKIFISFRSIFIPVQVFLWTRKTQNSFWFWKFGLLPFRKRKHNSKVFLRTLSVTNRKLSPNIKKIPKISTYLMTSSQKWPPFWIFFFYK